MRTTSSWLTHLWYGVLGNAVWWGIAGLGSLLLAFLASRYQGVLKAAEHAHVTLDPFQYWIVALPVPMVLFSAVVIMAVVVFAVRQGIEYTVRLRPHSAATDSTEPLQTASGGLKPLPLPGTFSAAVHAAKKIHTVPAGVTTNSDHYTVALQDLIASPFPDLQKSGSLADALDRQFVLVTPRFIMSLYDGHTTMQAQTLIAPYIGKWIVVSGKFSDVGRSGPEDDELTVTLEGDWIEVSFCFSREWEDRLAVIRPGAEITIHGKISFTTVLTVFVTECEIAHLG